jgi:transposase
LAALPLLQMSRPFFPFVSHVWADGGYNHARVTEATSIIVEIVKKQPDQTGFVVLLRRCVVERYFAWINRNRRLAKDFEATIKSAASSATPRPPCSSSGDWQEQHDFQNRL